MGNITLRVAEAVFVLWYSVETLLRIVGLRRAFFFGPLRRWNAFDLILLLMAYVELFLWSLQSADAKKDYSFLRLMRFIRLFRLFRAFRVLTELRIMMLCMAKSMGTFVWSGILLVFMLYVAALLSIQIATSYRAGDDFRKHQAELNDLVPGSGDIYARQVEEWFSNLAFTMVLLYQCAANGKDWGEVYTVYDQIGTFQALFFLFFILIFQFSFFNIITSIFVNKALRLGAPEQRKTEESLVKEKLLEVLAKRDFPIEDSINSEQLDIVLRDRGLRAMLRKFGLDVREVQLLFEMLTRIGHLDRPGHADELSVDQFVDQVMKVKGVATNQDLLSCRLDLTLLVMQVLEKTEALAKKIERMQLVPA